MPLKDYGKQKSTANDSLVRLNVIPDIEQPEKKIRFDLSSIESKLVEIRSNVEEVLEKADKNAASHSKDTQTKSINNKRKNKKGAIEKASHSQKGNSAQSSSKPVEFDYSKVDFKKFQGGSQKPQQNSDFKSKFHGKVIKIIMI